MVRQIYLTGLRTLVQLGISCLLLRKYIISTKLPRLVTNHSWLLSKYYEWILTFLYIVSLHKTVFRFVMKEKQLLIFMMRLYTLTKGIHRHQTPPWYRNATPRIAIHPIMAKHDVIHKIGSTWSIAESPEEDRATATGSAQNILWWSVQRFERYARGQTDKQMHWSQYSTPLLGRSNNDESVETGSSNVEKSQQEQLCASGIEVQLCHNRQSHCQAIFDCMPLTWPQSTILDNCCNLYEWCGWSMIEVDWWWDIRLNILCWHECDSQQEHCCTKDL